MKRISIIFLLWANSFSAQTIDSRGRTLEQIAMDYFISNLQNLDLNYADGCFNFNPQENKIWYKTTVLSLGQKGTRVRIANAVKATETEFFYAQCDKKDVFIMTCCLIKTEKDYTLDFYVVTQVNKYTGFTIHINPDLLPTEIEIGTHVHPTNSKCYTN